jgi:hypothetical protein
MSVEQLRQLQMLFAQLCQGEDSWLWSALLCGNHLGSNPLF